jgi:hypothetical protein
MIGGILLEIWKDIKGYEGLYQISNYGRVYSVRKNIIKTCTDFSKSRNKTWYPKVTLWIHQKAKTLLVHRLVAQHFLPNPNNYIEVNHKDGNKGNPHIDNLEWNTKSMNITHAYENNLFIPPRNKKVNQIDAITNQIINTFDSCVEAINFLNKPYEAKANINACARGERKKAYGFKWEFAY